MKFDEETLIEIEDYIQVLDEQVGLKPETMRDIEKAINKQKRKLKNCSIPHVSKSVCKYCGGSGELAGGLVGCHHCGNY